jgi:hypothetical protein
MRCHLATNRPRRGRLTKRTIKHAKPGGRAATAGTCRSCRQTKSPARLMCSQPSGERCWSRVWVPPRFLRKYTLSHCLPASTCARSACFIVFDLQNRRLRKRAFLRSGVDRAAIIMTTPSRSRGPMVREAVLPGSTGPRSPRAQRPGIPRAGRLRPPAHVRSIEGDNVIPDGRISGPVTWSDDHHPWSIFSQQSGRYPYRPGVPLGLRGLVDLRWSLRLGPFRPVPARPPAGRRRRPLTSVLDRNTMASCPSVQGSALPAARNRSRCGL